MLATLRKLKKSAGGTSEKWPSFFMLSLKDTSHLNRFVEFQEVVEELEELILPAHHGHVKTNSSVESVVKRTRERKRRRNATFGRRVRVDVVRSEIRILPAQKGLLASSSARRYKIGQIRKIERVHETQLDVDVETTSRSVFLKQTTRRYRLHWFMGSPSQRDYIAALIQGLCGAEGA